MSVNGTADPACLCNTNILSMLPHMSSAHFHMAILALDSDSKRCGFSYLVSSSEHTNNTLFWCDRKRRFQIEIKTERRKPTLMEIPHLQLFYLLMLEPHKKV